VTITVHYDHIHQTITIAPKDTWISLFDTISEQVLNDTNKSPYTGHYDHEMYYLTYHPQIGTIQHCSRCYTEGNPFDQINPTHVVSVNFALKNTRCCRCFIVPRDDCIICHRSRNDECSGDLVHNLYCGHELFCRQCADNANETHLIQCPICGLDNVKLANGFGKCYKCHKFAHNHSCDFTK